MSHSRQLSAAVRRRAVLFAALFAGAALVWAVAHAAQGEASTASPVAAQQQPVGCSFFFEPKEPLELNSVVSGRFVKSVAMEKELVRCVNLQSRVVVRVYDAELFIEIIERAWKGTIAPIEKRVELAVCAKDVRPQRTAPRVTCSARDVPLQPFPDPFVGCGWVTNQPSDPVEMNTVALQGRRLHFSFHAGEALIKTIKVEKELFDCDGPVVDLFLFTEIVEAESKGTIRPISKTFEAILCRKERATPEAAPRVRCMQVPTS
jgi:hypothetical protein